MSPVRLGPFRLEHPFILAPMAGITNSPFRRLMRQRGSAMVISELVSANGLKFASEKTRELLRFHEEERPVGLQIFGEDLDVLVSAAREIEKTGADFVDLNLGCPVPKVVRKGGGAALCRDLIRLGEILAALVGAVGIPVSIKIRTGWDSQSLNAQEVVRVAADVGVSWVTIHGRTRAQGYSGEADWDLIGRIKATASIPIIGNGDVSTPDVAMSRLAQYGVDAVMIGRGALRNPYLFEQSRALWRGEPLRTITPDDYVNLLMQQRQLLEDHFASRPRSALLHAKKFLSWYAAGFSGCHEFRRAVFSVSDSDELWGMAKAFFETHTRHRDMSFLHQPFLMGGHG